MYILGINAAYHDTSACLLDGPRIVAAIEEERLSRIKHAKKPTIDSGARLPWLAIRHCLDRAGIKLGDVSYIGFSLDPEVRRTNAQLRDRVVEGDWGSESGEKRFFEDLIGVPLALAWAGFRGRFYFLRHHLCHAASAFYPSPFSEAAVMTVDGIGELDCTSFSVGSGRNLEIVEAVQYPHSIGFLWEKLSEHLGFDQYDAYKVMGLAAHGDPSAYRDRFARFTSIGDDGTFSIDNEIMRFRSGEFAPLEEALELEKRKPGSEMTKGYKDVAATLQKLTEEALLALARRLHRETGRDRLCLAGGVALNCVANRFLYEGGPFKEMFVQPAANDGGTAIGAAQLLFHDELGGEERHAMQHAFFGPSYEERELRAAIEASGLPYHRSGEVEEETARLLADGRVVGWFQAAMEFGPRALGHRSLLADPRDAELRDRLNLMVKHREDFRPFAPSVLEEHAREWFAIEKPTSANEYMLMAYPARAERRALIPAVVHIDGTSRIHIVRREVDARYHRLISAFFALTGVPMLLNTSFNDNEPIVCAPEDALATFKKTRIDRLVLGDFIVERPPSEG